MTKIMICLISTSIILFIGVFFGYFILPLGLLGATSEKMMNLSFVVFIFWMLFVSILIPIGSFFTVDFLTVNASWNDFISALAAIAISVTVGIVLIIFGWITATVIGNQ